MAKVSKLPVISRVDFFRLKEIDFLIAAESAIARFAGKRKAEHDAIATVAHLVVDVPNGGLVQFYYNQRGDQGVKEAAKLMRTLKLPAAAELIEKSHAVYKANKKKFDTNNPWEGLFGGIKEFEPLDKKLMNFVLRCTRTTEAWIRANIKTLAVGDDGAAIDAKFSGAVETKQPNGHPGEYLEVKRGVASGAYREYFDDGTIRQASFYKGGEISGDFWPSGQIRTKTFKQGKFKVTEWYFPSGQVQKRFVANKDGYAAEPVVRFHENGQLAEKLHLEESNEVGPWLKFFEDGTPELEAENIFNKKDRRRATIIGNAWDENRKQIVKDGVGSYRDSARSISPSYNLYFEKSRIREGGIKNGKWHGKVTTYSHGVLWSVDHFEDGVLNGKSTLYWENGRVRTERVFKKGEASGEKEFPKFDKPSPAVVLKIRADEKLYTAWQHMAVDEYPQPLNLDAVKKQLKVPAFLQAIHERNKNNAVSSRYDDCNTFNDGIAYFLMVSETGEVVDVQCNGSGPMSGGEWETYKPLLRELKFSPGKIRGRGVKCQVLANVDHTFVES